MKTEKQEIANIVLCYKNEEEVLEYARMLTLLEKSEYLHLVVVINALKYLNVEEIKKELAKIKLKTSVYDPKENLGYMNGLLYGYCQFEREFGNIAEYVIMSNTDIDIVDKLFICKLKNKAYSEDVFCIGPSICVKELKSFDNPVAEKRRSLREINTLITKFSIPIFNQLYVWLAFEKPKFIKRKQDFNSRKVYEVHGCFFILTAECAKQLKKEKFGALMYSEETFIAENIYKRGKYEYYDADLEVVHLEHTVTSTLNAKKRADYMKESMRWIRSTFYY